LKRNNWIDFGAYFCIGDEDVKDWTILKFSTSGSNTPNITVFKENVLGEQKAHKEPKILRGTLAPALGIREGGGRLNEILKKEEYVQTPDFALKMVILNERRRVGARVIIEGDTGVGKTEVSFIFFNLLLSQMFRCCEFILSFLMQTQKSFPILDLDFSEINGLFISLTYFFYRTWASELLSFNIRSEIK